MSIRAKHVLKIVRRVLPWVIIGAVGYFMAGTLARNWSTIQSYDLKPNGYSVAGTLFFVVAVMSTGWLWGRLLARLTGKPVKGYEAVRVQISSWLLKYVPGQVGSFVGKLSWGKAAGYPQKQITVSFVYENVLLINSSLLLSLPILALLFFDRLGANLGMLAPALVAIPLLILSHKPVFYRVANTILTRAKKEPIEKESLLGFRELVGQHLLFMVPRIINAVGFVLIAASITHVTPSMWLGLGATYILAGIIGILALFVPSGIGVREGVIILFASAYFPVEVATLIALLARFYATIADGILALLYYGIKQFEKRKAT